MSFFKNLMGGINLQHEELKKKQPVLENIGIKVLFEKCNVYYYWNQIIEIMKKAQLYLIQQQEKQGYFLDSETNTFTNLILAMVVLQVFTVQKLMNLVHALMPLYQMIIHILRYIIDQILAIIDTQDTNLKIKKLLITLLQFSILYTFSSFAFSTLFRPICMILSQIINYVIRTIF